MLDTGITALAGNLFGGILNHAANRDFQERQFKEQEKMQQRAFEMNEQAVRNQAENMATGLERAGLNPAMVGNGAGAPTIAAGTAASGSSSLGQIFSGISELVQAIKAPTEIEKTAAETGLIGKQREKTTTETKQIIENMPKIRAEARKTMEDIRNMKNINQMFESERDFLKTNSGAIFGGYISQLKATGQWENLPKRTQMTLEDLAEGTLELDQGAIAALEKVINTQGNLSERDKQVLSNTKDMIITYNQITNEKVINAIANLPIYEQEKIIEEVKKIQEEVKNLTETRENIKQERILLTKQGAKIDSEARKNNTESDLKELNDLAYLIKKERWADALKLIAIKTGEGLAGIVKEAAAAKMGGKKKGKTQPQKKDHEYKEFK